MTTRRLSAYLFAGLGITLLLLAGTQAQPVKLPNIDPQPAPKPETSPLQNEILQSFPSNDQMKTAWKVHWATTKGYGLYIQDAFFKRGLNDPWMQVLGDARLSEAFVPYHRGSPRFWDVSYNFPLCAVTRDDAGPYGQLLSTGQGQAPTVVRELRDRGIIWKDALGGRRGQALVLWATLSAANYRYVIEYSFLDDGTIGFRLGSTGHNYPGSEWVGHMHNSLWRIDVNLDGPDSNSVYVAEHVEPDGEEKAKAKGMLTPFNGGKEGHLDWEPEKFTTLRVIHELKKNARGEQLSYEIMPLRMGNARHFGGEREECTQHDFWVTRSRPGELHYTRLPEYVKHGEPVLDTDVVLWYSAPGHHEPRSEDGEMIKGDRFQGATPIMWCGFDLRPRNIWDRSPFYP